MNVTVYLPGLTTIAMSSFFIRHPHEPVNAFTAVFDSYPLIFLSVIPTIVGLLFLISAHAISYPWAFRIVAVFAFAGAVLAIVNPATIFSRIVDGLFRDISDRTHRLFGNIFGAVMITWIR